MVKPTIETTPEDDEYSAAVRENWKMQCPKCETAHSLRISAEVTVDLLPNGTEVDMESDTTWGDDSYCACGHCGHFGDVKDFEIPEAATAKAGAA
jgi:phage terminase large subunit GpA-like protein